MTILGVDICQGRAVCWPLDRLPEDPKSYWREQVKLRSRKADQDPWTFPFNKEGIATFLSWGIEAVAMEPTGMRYNALLADVCQIQGIKIFWIGHAQCKNARLEMKLPDKNDLADAFALACYAAQYQNYPKYFLEFCVGPISELKDFYLKAKSVSRFQTAAMNRLKIQLAYEFPEASEKQWTPGRDGRRSLICWLGSRDRIVRPSGYWQSKRDRSVSSDWDIEISNFSKQLAGIVDDYDLMLIELESKMKWLLDFPAFEKYNRVFDRFNFGLFARSILLCQIYPFERFDTMAGFKRRLGYGKVERSSGSKSSFGNGEGSKLISAEMYLWVMNSIAIKSRRPTSEVGKKIATFYDGWQEKLYANPELYRAAMLSKSKDSIAKALFKVLEKELSPLLSKEDLGGVIGKIGGVADLIGETDGSIEIDPSVAAKKFGKLILCKTSAYTCRWLYRELKRELGN
jgi:hypothetical protein